MAGQWASPRVELLVYGGSSSRGCDPWSTTIDVVCSGLDISAGITITLPRAGPLGIHPLVFVPAVSMHAVHAACASLRTQLRPDECLAMSIQCLCPEELKPADDSSMIETALN